MSRGGRIQCAIESWPLLGSTNRQLHWISNIEIVLGWPSNLLPWRIDHYFGQFWKLGFFLVSECPISIHMGWLCKFLDHECVAIVPTWNLPKHACTTHRKAFLMHNFHSMPWVGIQRVSLKVWRRWDSTCHRIMNVSWIDEPSAPLDSGHQDSSRVAL